MLDVQKVNTISFSTDCQDAEGKKEKKKLLAVRKKNNKSMHVYMHKHIHTTSLNCCNEKLIEAKFSQIFHLEFFFPKHNTF